MPNIEKLLACALAITWLAIVPGCSQQFENEAKVIDKKESNSSSISVTIDFDDRLPTIDIDEVAVPDRTTILEAMKHLEAEGRIDKFRFDYRGKGKTAFLTSILGVENEGGDARNWMFDVNGVPGDRSFAAYELKHGDAVRWKFKKYEE